MDPKGEFYRRLEAAAEMGWEGRNERERMDVGIYDAIEEEDKEREEELRGKKREYLAQHALDKQAWYTSNFPQNSPWQQYAREKTQMRQQEMNQGGRTLETDKRRVDLANRKVDILKQDVARMKKQRQTGLKRNPQDMLDLELAKTRLKSAEDKLGRKQRNMATKYKYERKVPSAKGSVKGAFKLEKQRDVGKEIKGAMKEAKKNKPSLIPKKQPIPLSKEKTLQKQHSDKTKAKTKETKNDLKKKIASQDKKASKPPSSSSSTKSKKAGAGAAAKLSGIAKNFKQKRAAAAAPQKTPKAAPRPRRVPQTVGGAKVATPPKMSKGFVNTMRSRFMGGGRVKNAAKALGGSTLTSAIHPLTVTENMVSDRDFFAKIREGQFFLKRVEEALNPNKVVEENATWTKWFNYCKTFLTLWWIAAFGTVFVFMFFDTFQLFDFVFSRDMIEIHRFARPSIVWGMATLVLSYSVSWDFAYARTESYLMLFALLFIQTLAFSVDFVGIHGDFEWFECPWFGTDNCVEPFDGVTSVIAQVGWYLAALAHVGLTFCTSVLFFGLRNLRSRWWLFAQWHHVVRVVDTYFEDLSALRREWDVAVGLLSTRLEEGDPSEHTPEEWVKIVMESPLFNRFTSDTEALETVEDLLLYLIPNGKEIHVWMHNVRQKKIVEQLFSKMYRVSAEEVDAAQITVAEFRNNFARELPYLYKKPMAYDKNMGPVSRFFLMTFTQVVVIVTFVVGSFVTLWFIFYSDDTSLMDSALFSVRTRYLFDVGFGATSLILAMAWESAAMLLDPVLMRYIRFLGILCLAGPVVGWYYIYNVACEATLHPICTLERASDYTGTAFFALWMIVTIAYPTLVNFLFTWAKDEVMRVNLARRHAAFSKLKRTRPRWHSKLK